MERVMRRCLFLLILPGFVTVSAGQADPVRAGQAEAVSGMREDSLADPISQRNTLKLLFTGDIMGHDSQIASALAHGGDRHDYRPCFQYLEPYFTGADLVIGNLEVTLAGPPYKGYPQFSSPDELADALLEAGFDVLITANNHALDRGDAGLQRTLGVLDHLGILHTGTFRDAGERERYYPLVLEKNGIRIALLNYTYGTNGLKAENPVAVNYIDTARIRTDLQKAALASPDLTILTLHWGNEYERSENSSQRELARFALANGADAIIGSHPHVVQPVNGKGKGELVAYSLGNFISNQRPRYRDGGIVFEMEVIKDAADTRIARHAYLPVWVHKPQTEKGTLFTLVPAAVDSAVSSALDVSREDYIHLKRFHTDTRMHLWGVGEVEPSWLDPAEVTRTDQP
ncbi:MAG TPA: CapA family protein [Bacteroides sp.]|nr:CapA family protein [Bacteroides sp.]